MSVQPVYIAGQWRPARASGKFQAINPGTCQALAAEYPISGWEDCDEALNAATRAAMQIRTMPATTIPDFLDRYAERIEQRKAELVETAHQETALPPSPRLADVELPRTIGQLRQAAAAARDGSWAMPTIDTKNNIRSCYVPLGPVCVFGPNNFPFAFGSASGGDFAAAVAAGNPVIAKAHTSHPATTRIFAEEAAKTAEEGGLPAGFFQLIYRISHADGERLVSDHRVGATGYTGSRSAGLRLKAAADATGKPIYLELSSVNPVVILPGALRERGEEIAAEFSTSCLMGAGQFCTNPGLVLLMECPESEALIKQIAARFADAPVGTLLSQSVAKSLINNVAQLIDAGADVVVGNKPGGGHGFSFANTLLRVSGERFINDPHALQTEAFGNVSLVVVAHDAKQLEHVVNCLEGNLTGSLYTDRNGSDDEAYQRLAPQLSRRVGRLLNDKMPTGVAVSPAMNHGGPFPATGHPGFTAVGIPASLRRFAALQCFDGVRASRLPTALQDANPTGSLWRLIDGQWSQSDVGS